MAMADQDALQVQLLCVPDCPLVERVQSTLEKCLAQTGVRAVVQALVGDYTSPTLLVDGFDVTGRPRPPDGQTACRCDLPTEEQILAALRGFSIVCRGGARAERLQAVAFQTLLRTVKPVSMGQLVVATMGISSSEAGSSMAESLQRGHVCLDSTGCVVGALGLSLSPTPHELAIKGKTLFWAWSAFDALGIFAVLGASGSLQSKEPYSHEIIKVDFVDGIPQVRNLVVFMPDLLADGSMRARQDWSQKVNFFMSRVAAEEWGERNRVNGSILSVETLVPVSRQVWLKFLQQA